jgi:hypothetical protein
MDHTMPYDKSHRSSHQTGRLDYLLMTEFAVLTNRRRALIALAHSIVFLGIALHGFVSPRSALVLHAPGAVPGVILVAIYLIVASVLAWLVSISRCAPERLYFALCASSAPFGLLRTILGDASLPAAQYLRVLMLSGAIIVGTWIVRSFSRSVPEDVLSD